MKILLMSLLLIMSLSVFANDQIPTCTCNTDVGTLEVPESEATIDIVVEMDQQGIYSASAAEINIVASYLCFVKLNKEDTRSIYKINSIKCDL